MEFEKKFIYHIEVDGGLEIDCFGDSLSESVRT
jgi:hypothetical protein